MRTRRTLRWPALVLCAGLLAVPAAAAPLPVATQGEDVPDKRPEVEELLTQLADHVKKGGEADTDAVTVIDKLNQEFKASGPKDRADIVKGIAKCFEARRRTKEGEPPNNKLYLAAAVVLGEMGPESTKSLIKWIDHKDLRKDLQVQDRLIRSLGKTKDPEGVKTLRLMLENEEPALVGSAAEALGEFEGAELKLRKDVFESLLKVLMSAKGAKDGDVNDTIARDRYDVIAAPIVTSLRKLSGHEESDPDQWQHWWNKNKREDWDKED